MLSQTKKLVQENKELVEAQGKVEDFAKEKTRLISEINTLRQQNESLDNELEKFKTHFKNLTQDRAQIEMQLREAQSADAIVKMRDKYNDEIRELKDEVTLLKRQNKNFIIIS